MVQLSAEQREATAIDDNLLVNAGAGSGKTTVLTQRYIRLLQEGDLEPQEIVAITFTNKAAREMRERIDARLAEMGGKWSWARDQLVAAPISTIHAFYASVLRAFPVEARVEPSFKVLEELDASLMLQRSADAAIAEALGGDCPHLALLTQVLGAQALEVQGGLARQLVDIHRTLGNRGIPVEEMELSNLYAELPPWQQSRDKFLEIIATHEDVAAALGQRDRPEMAELRQSLIQAAEILSQLQSPGDTAQHFDFLVNLVQQKAGRFKVQKEFVQTAQEQLRLLLTAGLAPVLAQALFSLLTRVDNIYTSMKRTAGALDFADLQLAVWSLLQEYPSVVELLRSRYTTYMVDEFQDTDRLQYRIISVLVEEDGEIPPGRLFVVGDEKQSIYRFRGADVQVFGHVRHKLTCTDARREKKITCNYRSRSPLIEMVNNLFGQLMEEGHYTPLSAHRRDEVSCSEIIALSPEEDESNAEAEARIIAARIREMVEGQEKLVGDEHQPVQYGDIALLVRTRTNLQEYQHYLRLAGVPYTVVGGIGFYQQQEIVDLVNLLQVVDNWQNELALTAVLRSPMVSLDDDSLLALREAQRQQGGTLLDHGSILGDEQHLRCQRAQKILGQLREARGLIELPDLVDLALDLTGYRELTLTRFAGRQYYANLEKFIQLAENYREGNLSSFLTWLEKAAEYPEAAAEIEEGDAVKIMTIHASKGLEFPVVFIPTCSTQLKLRTGSMLVDEEGKLAFKQQWTCPVWEQVKEREKELETAELKRQLYVAMTRARDYLVALVRPVKSKEISFNTWLQELVPGEPNAYGLGDTTAKIALPNPLPEPGADTPWQPKDFFPGLAPVGPGPVALRYYSISQFMLWRQDREEFRRRYLTRSLPRTALVDLKGEQPGGTEFGNLLHGALEVLTPTTAIDTLLEELLHRYYPGVEHDQRKKVFCAAKNMLESAQRQPAPPGNFTQVENELEFYHRMGPALFYGLMDKVLIGPEEIAVVDYKTNRITDGIQALVETYASQLRFYAMTAEAIYRRPVRAYLQLLRLPPRQQLVEIDLGPQQQKRLVQELEEFVAYYSGAMLDEE